MNFTPIWKDQIPYLDSLNCQEELKNSCLQKFENFALGFECPTVITLGLRGTDEDLLLTRQDYKKRKIPIINIQRGGQATLHSLGQLIIYPIADIKKNKIRVRDFIESIEKITQQTLKNLGIATHKEEGQAGLFTKVGKIAFFGIHVTQGISQHGLSINVSNDVDLFSCIRSCGTEYRIHDTISKYHSQISLKEVFDLWIQTALQME